MLHIPSAQSLKQRRQVVRSCKDRIRAKLPVSIAEVGDVERLQVAALGVAVVSSDAARCDEILGAARSMMSQLRDAVLADVKIELIPMGEGGKGIVSGDETPLGPDDASFASDLPEHWAQAFPLDTGPEPGQSPRARGKSRSGKSLDRLGRGHGRRDPGGDE